MRKVNLLLVAVIMFSLTAFNVSPLYSQGNTVTIRLHQPPPNQLNISSLWKATLTNNTKGPIKIYLEGFAEEEKGGKIVEGRTEVFTLPLGKKDYKYEDFKTGTVNWINKKYEEPIIRTGTAPSGTYTICMTAKNEQGDVVGMEQCITQIVDIKTDIEISLISPENEEKIKPENINFLWTGTGIKGPYSLRIVELLANQSPEEAMRKNQAFFEKKDILSTQYQYISSNPKFQTGRKYAWQILAGDNRSGISSFTIQSEQNYKISFESILCGASANEFTISMKVVNNHPTLTLKIINLECYTPSVTFDCLMGPVNTPAGQSISNISPSLASTNIPSNGGSQIYTMTGNKGTTNDNYFNIRIAHQYQGSSGGYDCDSIMIPVCNCCENFTKTVENINVVQDNTNNINLTANISAGPVSIKKVTAEMVYVYQNWGDTNCTKCVNDSKLMGNFTGGTLSSFGSGSLNASPFALSYSREIDFYSGAGVDMSIAKLINLNLSLPPASGLTCCADTIRLCIRFSFTNANCVKCETVICRKIVRTYSGITNTAGGIKSDNDDIIHLILDENKVKSEDPKIKNHNSQTPGYSVSFDPSENGCCFNVKVSNTSGNTLWNAFRINSISNQMTSVSAINSTSTNPASISSPVTILDWKANNSFPPGTTSCGTICLNNTTSSIPINISWSTNGGASFAPPDEEHMITCQTQNNDCDLDTLVIRTGWDYGSSTGQVYNTGVADGFWRVRGPNLTTGVFGSTAWVIERYINAGYTQPFPWAFPQPWIGNPASWLPLSTAGTDLTTRQSQWLSAIPHGNYGPSEYYEYEFRFCMKDTAGVKMTLNIRADDEATVFLNGVNKGFTGQNTFKTPSPFAVTITSDFVPNSTNSLIIKCENTGGEAMGLNVYGWVVANGLSLEKPVCCNPTGNVLGYKWIDRNHDGTPQESEYLPNWHMTLTGPGGTFNSTTSSNGYYYFLDVPPGNYTLSEQQVPGYQFTDPSNGVYNNVQVTVGNTVQYNFKNDTLIGQPPSNCCDDFDINIQSTNSNINQFTFGSTTSPILYVLGANVSAGPNRIKRIRTFMTNFTQTYNNADCQQCVNSPINWGSFVGTSDIMDISYTGSVPTNNDVYWINKNWRETIWENTNGNSISPLSNVAMPFLLFLPYKPTISCCADTIRFSIKYEFTDTTCKTCDTTIWYQVVLSGSNSGVVHKTSLDQKNYKMLPKEIKDMIEKSENSPRGQGVKENRINNSAVDESKQLIMNTSGENNAMLEIRTEKFIQLKLTLFDISGKKIIDIIDKITEKCNYEINFSEYNLPDGIYFCKIEKDGISEIKVLYVVKFFRQEIQY